MTGRSSCLTERERVRVAKKAIDALPSMAVAHFWIRVYRDHLYRDSRFGRRIERRMRNRIELAQSQAWHLLDLCGLKSIWPHDMKHGRVLEWNIPAWNEVPYGTESTVRRAWARARWWHGRSERWVEHWRFVATALGDLKLRSWPLSERDKARTRQYLERECVEDERRKIQAAVAAEAQRELIKRQEKERRREVKREAQSMLGEIIPGARTRRLMSKAQGFDTLIKLLEEANVDAQTKIAIIRLKELVGGERRAAGRLSPGLNGASEKRERGRHRVDHSSALPAANGRDSDGRRKGSNSKTAGSESEPH